jgi:transcriptional regulator
MYLPVHFAETRTEVLHALVRAHPLATLVTLSSDGLLANHVPLQLLAGAGPQGRDLLRGHVARANPLWQDRVAGVDALVVFQGPQHYVSPNWYPSKQETGKVVPTWNYCCVHARGALQVHDDADWVRAQVGSLTSQHEEALARPWAVEDAPADYVRSMLAMIVGIEIDVTRLTGKWKMSQNQPPRNRAGVIAGLDGLDEAQAKDVAGLVRERNSGS